MTRTIYLLSKSRQHWEKHQVGQYQGE